MVPVNDAPTLTATAPNPTFQEAANLGTQAAAVSVFSGANANTIESGQTITGLTFTVSGLADGANETVVVDGKTITLQEQPLVAAQQLRIQWHILPLYQVVQQRL